MCVLESKVSSIASVRDKFVSTTLVAWAKAFEAQIMATPRAPQASRADLLSLVERVSTIKDPVMQHPSADVISKVHEISVLASELASMTEASLTLARARELEPHLRGVFVEQVYLLVEKSLPHVVSARRRFDLIRFQIRRPLYTHCI